MKFTDKELLVIEQALYEREAACLKRIRGITDIDMNLYWQTERSKVIDLLQRIDWPEPNNG